MLEDDLPKEIFFYPCIQCGNLVQTTIKRSTTKFKCENCKEQFDQEQSDILKKEISKLQRLRRIEGVKELILSQHHRVEDYEHALNVIAKKIDHLDWFQSIPEMAAAAELIRWKIKAFHQVKIKRYRADFVLPDSKVVLEIDGFFHEDAKKIAKDAKKDQTMILKLGMGWEVVRLKDTLIKTDLQKLVPSIKSIVQNRRKVRKSHGGELPYNYSQQF